jgi:membrane associated rhomboid family serine protease
MARYPSSGYRIAIGPGGVSPAVKALLIANIAMFVLTSLVPISVHLEINNWFGLKPDALLTQGRIWQPVTYMFLHADTMHILFNMLGLWMFGVELERMWGTPFFIRYYFATGIGAALVIVALSFLPSSVTAQTYRMVTIGASGAIFGLLLAYGLSFPNRPIYLYFLFEIPAKYFVMIVGAVVFFSSVSSQGGGISHTAHLGGLVVGYFYLRGRRMLRWSPVAEVKYRYLRWKIARMRKKFDVVPGGRSDDWDQRIH